MRLTIIGLIAFVLLASPAAARTLCTVVADAETGHVLIEDGDCRTRVTPASTFKMALAVMGFDAGVLDDAERPALPFRKGYADWGGDAWKRENTPRSWMKHSVVWYSQRIAEALGVGVLERYARDFGYGNADFSGDPGKNNALERAWISSSLKIAPVEQVGFVRNLINGKLPVSREAASKAMGIVEQWPTPGGWTVWGKTGSAYPRLADGSFDRAAGWGWFVGWAKAGERTLVFARLIQDEKRERVSGGLRARDALLADFDGLAASSR
jgi:beta-lactamase class D